MVNNYLSKLFSLIVLCLCFTFAQAQDCDNPTVIVDDNFDSYTAGALGPQATHWTTWSGTEGGAEDGIVSSDQSNSPDNSMYIEGGAGGGPQDVLLLCGNKTDGNYLLSWNFFIPEGNGCYYNIQHSETPAVEWAHQITFNADGTANLDAGVGDVRIFDYPQSEWFSVFFVIDVTNDFIYLYVDEEFLYAWPFSWQTFQMTGLKQLGSIDYFPIDATHVFYTDDVYYAQIPEAGPGQYCHLALNVGEGTHTVSEVTCFGGPDPFVASGAAWYAYTPAEDGVMSVGSCNGGADTRVWVYSGDCGTRTLEGVNDDLCEMGAGADEYASYREVLVSGGTTYYIAWDNVWEETGFDFEIALTPGAGTGGNFCETAIVVDPGVHTIDQVNGHAAVAGPNIGNFVSSTTPYSQSEWYSFTAQVTGNASISSCGLTSEDTRVWVYSGTCGFDNLTLVASDNDGCGDVQSLVLDMPVTEGETYYIEWSSEELDAAGFDWELNVEIPTVAVTFRVDMTGQTVDPLGVNIGGDFTNFLPEPMTNTGGNIWEATFDLPENTAIGWRYLNGLAQEPSIAPDGDLAPCGVDDMMGGFARAYMTTDQDFEFDAACFGYCVTCNFINTTEEEFEAGLSIQPNPASNVTNITFNFQEATDLSVRLTNALGQLISVHQLDNAQNGNLELDIADLASGTYNVIMTNGEHVVTKRLVIK